LGQRLETRHWDRAGEIHDSWPAWSAPRAEPTQHQPASNLTAARVHPPEWAAPDRTARRSRTRSGRHLRSSADWAVENCPAARPECTYLGRRDNRGSRRGLVTVDIGRESVRMHASTRRALGVVGVWATAMILMVAARRQRVGGRHRRPGAHMHRPGQRQGRPHLTARHGGSQAAQRYRRACY
jgi:hypothetical protein